MHPEDLLGLHLPTFSSEERARSRQQRYQRFNGWGSLKQGPEASLMDTGSLKQGPCKVDGRGLCSQREEEIPLYRGNWCQVGSLVTRENSREVWEVWPSKALWYELSLAWGRSKSVGKPVLWVGHLWSRHWLSREEENSHVPGDRQHTWPREKQPDYIVVTGILWPTV